MNGELTTTAIELAAQGYYVFPVRVQGKDKLPLIKEWQNKATNEWQQIGPMFDVPGVTHVGIACGPSGLVVIDVDLPEGPNSLTFLEKTHGPLPATLNQRTLSGGTHLVYKSIEQFKIGNSVSKIGKDLDIRADGGYIVYYGWTDPNTPVSLCNPLYYHRMIYNKYVLAAIDGESKKLIELPPDSKRNNQLNEAGFKLGQKVAEGVIDEQYIRGVLLVSGISSGLEEEETKNTIESGISAGKNQVKSDPVVRELTTASSSLVSGEPLIEKMRKSRIRMQDIETEDPVFLWDGYIEAAGLAVLVGDGGVGKGMLSSYLIAELSRGTLPGLYEGKPIKSLFLSTEENYNSATKPRLLAQNADPAMVDFIDSSHLHLALTTQYSHELCRMMKEDGFGVVVFDPIIDYFPDGKRDVEVDVRSVLSPLQSAAREYGVTVIAIRHIPKGNSNQEDMILGSKAWRNVARSCIGILKDSEDSAVRVVFNLKMNNSAEQESARGFRIEGKQIDGLQKPVGHLVWEDRKFNKSNVIELHGLNSRDKEENLSKTEKNRQALITFLRSRQGSAPAREVIEYVTNTRNMSKGSVYRVADEVGIIKGKRGDPDSTWSLPEELGGVSESKIVDI